MTSRRQIDQVGQYQYEHPSSFPDVNISPFEILSPRRSANHPRGRFACWQPTLVAGRSFEPSRGMVFLTVQVSSLPSHIGPHTDSTRVCYFLLVARTCSSFLTPSRRRLRIRSVTIKVACDISPISQPNLRSRPNTTTTSAFLILTHSPPAQSGFRVLVLPICSRN